MAEMEGALLSVGRSLRVIPRRTFLAMDFRLSANCRKRAARPAGADSTDPSRRVRDAWATRGRRCLIFDASLDGNGNYRDKRARAHDIPRRHEAGLLSFFPSGVPGERRLAPRSIEIPYLSAAIVAHFQRCSQTRASRDPLSSRARGGRGEERRERDPRERLRSLAFSDPRELALVALVDRTFKD